MIWLTRRVSLPHRRAEEIVHHHASFLLRFDTHGYGAFLISGKGTKLYAALPAPPTAD